MSLLIIFAPKRTILCFDAQRNTCFKATLPTISLCFILAILGIIVFTISSKALSRWMVKPIENTILSEKNLFPMPVMN